MKSAAFELHGGNYTITWTATDNQSQSKVGCSHGGSLQRVDPPPASETIANASVSAGRTATGETHAYNLRAGRYFLNMSSGCEWTVTLTRD
jgi:hypothetical protein